ncbi:ATP-binding protein [Streptomyces sp. BR123]|uniref:ATP-binding protein n=1 Tax=Streptomyces sp. BR123 TaxID=2749828 RepID=UPI0015C4885A|nr:ATP-binding protein [Streptomyces sp. BR123]NXY95436.1 ATP-binding protein [Streptomyces sp. BR123]
MTDPARHCECRGIGAAARAREEVRRLVDDAANVGHVLPESVEHDALLVASELVANAVRHTGGLCLLDVTWADDGIDIDVTDSSPHPPRLRPPVPAGAVGGYGWPLVNRLASHVEVRPTSAGGKTIHAHLPGAL